MKLQITPQSEVCVIGRHGFIGSAIAGRFLNVSATPVPGTQVLFHFGSYTHGEFDKNPRLHHERTFADFEVLLRYCQKHRIAFVYPSSALVYEEGSAFGKFKKDLEWMVSQFNVTSIGLRIFPVYGPGESRSVISKWCREMAAGKRPVLFGDGSQERDFIYIDDVVDRALELLSTVEVGQHLVADVGNGYPACFAQIIAEINRQLNTGLEPVEMPAPAGYRQAATVCSEKRDSFIRMREGIHRTLMQFA